MNENDIGKQVIDYLKTLTTPHFRSRNIETEFSIQIGSYSTRADIVLLLHNTPIVIVECKRANKNNKGKEQLESYLLASEATLGILAQGSEKRDFYRKNFRNKIREINQAAFEDYVNTEMNRQNERYRYEAKKKRKKHEMHCMIDQICQTTHTDLNQTNVSINLENQRVVCVNEKKCIRQTVYRVKINREDIINYKVFGEVLDNTREPRWHQYHYNDEKRRWFPVKNAQNAS